MKNGASIYSTESYISIIGFYPTEKIENFVFFQNFSQECNLFGFLASNLAKPLQGHTPGSSGGKAKAASLFFGPSLWKF
jgi:hypothetical protein